MRLDILFLSVSLKQLEVPLHLFNMGTALIAAAPRYHTRLEQLSSIDLDSDTKGGLLTRIVCTIGPAATKETIKDLLKAGMTVARLNFSHHSHAEFEQRLRMIREAVKELDVETKQVWPLFIALDTKGPEIRTGIIERGGEVQLRTGNQVTLTVYEAERDKCSDKRIYVNYTSLPEILNANEEKNIYIDDGKIVLKCISAGTGTVTCTVLQGGLLGSTKGVIIPGADLNLPAVSEQDKLDLQFGVDHGVDMIFASFVQNAEGARAIRLALGEGGKDVLIVSKIETQQALDNIDEIIKASDAIMVARGGLGVHMPITRVFQAQKAIVAKCNLAWTPVICATQMLESMMDNIRPSRADVSDIANAVFDGADAVMLSGETSVGKYPVECVKTMVEICKFAETSLWHAKTFEELTDKMLDDGSNIAAVMGCVHQSISCNSCAIIIASVDAVSPIWIILVAICKPNCPIITNTGESGFRRELALWRGIYQLKTDKWSRVAATNKQLLLEYAKEKEFTVVGRPYVTLSFEKDNVVVDLSY